MSRIILHFLIVLFAASTVVADDDRQLVAKGAKVEKLAGGMKFTEGPVWLPEEKLVFSDIPNSKLMQWSEADGLSVYRDSEQANGNILDLQGRIISCQHKAKTSFASRPTAVQLCWRTALTANGSIRRTMWQSGPMELYGLQIRHGD